LSASDRPRSLRRLLEAAVFLANTILVSVPFIIQGEGFYLLWWSEHLINRIAGILLLPVALVASFWIALFIQVGTADRPLRISFALLGAFFLFAGLEKIWRAGISWASLRDGSLALWGVAFIQAAALGFRPGEHHSLDPRHEQETANGP
jgi:hypothetical protein